MGPERSAPSGSFASDRIILLWAFVEVALGGLLHAFRVPFTGITVGSAAVLCLCLLGDSVERPREILRGLVIILGVKLAVTPHAPAGAFFAVAFQGTAAWLLFHYVRSKPVACLLLGVLGLMQSSIQKLVFMTLLYGMSLWEAIDVLAALALGFFGLTVPEGMDPSSWIIGAYLVIHLFAGILVGIMGAKLPDWIRWGMEDPAIGRVLDAGQTATRYAGPVSRPGKERLTRQIKRATGLLLTAVLVGVLVGLDREGGAGPLHPALLILLRVVLVALVYLFLIAPMVRYAVRRFTNVEDVTQAGRIARIIEELPRLRPMAVEAWKVKGSDSGSRILRSLRLFLASTLYQKNRYKQ